MLVFWLLVKRHGKEKEMVPEKQNLCPGSRSAVFLLPGTSFRGRRPHEWRRRDGSGACAGSAHRIEFSYEDNKLSRVESEEGSLDLESRWEAPVR